MAFNNLNWARTAAYGYEGSQIPVDFKYNGVAEGETTADLLASNYFLPVWEQLTLGSMVLMTATDLTLVIGVCVNSSSTNVSMGQVTLPLAINSVGTDYIKDGAVTPVKTSFMLNNQIYTTVAGAANTVTMPAPVGVLATDVVQVSMHTLGATPVTILSAVAGAGNVVITFSADPSTDHKVNISVFRPGYY